MFARFRVFIDTLLSAMGKALLVQISRASLLVSKGSKQLAQFNFLILQLQRDYFFQALPQKIQGTQEVMGLQTTYL